jgi:type I restriction enzyme S subunit
MGQAPKGASYNSVGNGYPLIAGAGDFGETTPLPSKSTVAPIKLSDVDDIILCIRATIGDLNWSDKEYCLGRGVAGLRANDGILDQDYLWHWLSYSADYLKSKGRGATFLQVSKADIASLQIPLPPLAEQKRIAAILDAADALRAKRRESLAQLDTLLQSTFLDMFGDPVTNPKGWEIKVLRELGTLDRGVSKHRPRNAPFLLGGPYPLIQTGDVSNSGGYIREFTSTYSEAGLKQSKMWPAGTLCITIAANIANTGILSFDACFPDSVVGFRSEEDGRAEYVQGLFWFFRNILEKKAPQVAQKNINLKILRGMPVPVPPIGLQRRFATIVESVEQQKTRLRNHLTELDTLFASLQQRAFNGDL